MARKLRIQFPGAVYHLVNRGDRGDAIFRDEQDRERFLQTLTETCTKTGWQVFAYCLLPDHFHLVIRTPKANLVEGMKWFLGTYTARFNRRHPGGGHLFSGRYKSQYLDSNDGNVLLEAVAYLHLNPVRSGLLEGTQTADRFPWSSQGDYLKEPSQRPPWLDPNPLFKALGLEDTEAGREQWKSWIEQQRVTEAPDRWKGMRTGWYVGSEEFRRVLLETLREGSHSSSTGLLWKASDEQHAERRLEAILQERGWTSEELKDRPKTDPEKVFVAQQLRRDTTMTLTWIAQRLQMGSRNTLRNAIAAASPLELGSGSGSSSSSSSSSGAERTVSSAAGPSSVFRTEARPTKTSRTADTPFKAASGARPRVPSAPKAASIVTPAPAAPRQEESSVQVEPGWD